MAKITKAEMPALAEQIVKCLGGKENVARINHCATRLRVNPVDMEKVDKDGLKRLHGVIGIDSSKAELQIIVGAIIEDLYLEVEKITGNGGGAVADDVPFWKKRPSEIFSSFLLLMAGCLSPVIPALIASGLLATVLTIMTLVLHVDASTSSTYSILYNLSQTVFYFMPVLVAYTSAKKFGTEPVLAMVLACFLLYPDWVAGEKRGATQPPDDWTAVAPLSFRVAAFCGVARTHCRAGSWSGCTACSHPWTASSENAEVSGNSGRVFEFKPN